MAIEFLIGVIIYLDEEPLKMDYILMVIDLFIWVTIYLVI